jgi:hypothetical protein
MPEYSISVLPCAGRIVAFNSPCKELRVRELTGLAQSRYVVCQDSCGSWTAPKPFLYHSLSPTAGPLTPSSIVLRPPPQLRYVPPVRRSPLFKPPPQTSSSPSPRSSSIASTLACSRYLTSHLSRLLRREARKLGFSDIEAGQSKTFETWKL